MFAKDLTREETEFWVKFMTDYSMAELRYAFEQWGRNGRFFPKPKDVAELCEAYRMSLAEQQFPIGCHRCNWMGMYEASAGKFRPCPCIENPRLREKQEYHFGEGYGTQDMLWVYEHYRQENLRAGKVMPMTDGLMDSLLDKLDARRGSAPAWRNS